MGNDNEWKQILTIKERLKLYTNKQDIKYRINTFYNRYNIDIEKTLTNQTFNIWDIDIDQNDDEKENDMNTKQIFNQRLQKFIQRNLPKCNPKRYSERTRQRKYEQDTQIKIAKLKSIDDR